MKLATIERTKLLASALDRASTVCLTVGVAAPVAAVAFGTGAAEATWELAIKVLYWLCGALLLHILAHWVLGGLKNVGS